MTWNISKLQPLLEIEGKAFSLHIDKMVTLHKQRLKTKVINISTHRDDITGALDLFFTGF
jgi:hypothetical protein